MALGNAGGSSSRSSFHPSTSRQTKEDDGEENNLYGKYFSPEHTKLLSSLGVVVFLASAIFWAVGLVGCVGAPRTSPGLSSLQSFPS